MTSPRRPTRSSLIWASGPRGPAPRASTQTPAEPPVVKPAPSARATRPRTRPPRPAATTRVPRGSRAGEQPRSPLPAGIHPLTDQAGNARLRRYEEGVKSAFDRIVPVMKQLTALVWTADFESTAQRIAEAELGFGLPSWLLEDAWIGGLNVKRLFAWSVFETYRRMADDFFTHDPLGGREVDEFERFARECGFHLMDITPCADGRLAHVTSYVLRLPCGAVRRKSYAGGLFDVENTVAKWVEVELGRFREGKPNTADAPTRYLKSVVYHYSSVDPSHQGCAAHGSDDAKAASAALERLQAFRQAVENSFCCGASVDLLLIGLDTDTDAIRVHVPGPDGSLSTAQSVDATKVYAITRDLEPTAARERIAELVRAHAPAGADAGMIRLAARLIENNLSQIDYVRQYHGGHYEDRGHAERFMGVGIGFEEIQLRNLTYFAYLDTVEEGAPDLDVGCKIFGGLNVSHGLPIPVVIRFDYHGGVPGARERAIARVRRLDSALTTRFPELAERGMLQRLLAVRDRDLETGIEVIGDSLGPAPTGGH
ncbi:MAG: carboxysome shell carbonic anhydrase [Sphingobacteriia bacterium]|nr:carboxysome shell carbonic anhydrase [Sphingobacteriia bacterium]NCC40693.1 carboxysome shell carbonic anhydrase [Gammaproteobacteria bacterium]